MKKNSISTKILVGTLQVMFAVTSHAGVVANDTFSGLVGAEPAGWASVEAVTVNQHAFIEAGSLSYPGLADSTGNRLGLSNKTQDYFFDFDDVTLGSGESIYFSLIITVDTLVSNFGNQFYGSFQLQGTSSTLTNVQVGIGTTGYNSENPDSTLWGVSVDGRNRGYNHVDAITGPNEFSMDTTHLIVGAYTRNDSKGVVSVWVDPSVSTFGTSTPPTAYLTDVAHADQTTFTGFGIYTNGSGGLPADWAIDELRIGTDWSDVVPAAAAVPETSTVALMVGLAAFGWLVQRRRLNA